MDQSSYYFFASASAVAAALTFAFSVWKGRQDIQRSREVSARAAWEAYLEMAFDHPKLSRAAYDQVDLDEFEKYEWFVSRMLYAAEEVLTLTSQSKPWNDAISSQIGYHRDYLKGQGREYMRHYSSKLQALVSREFANA